MAKNKSEYDFPEIGMNKKDVIVPLNKSSIINNVLIPYKMVALDLGIEEYTFFIKKGKIQEIKREVHKDVDFIIHLSLKDLKRLIKAAEEGHIRELIRGLLTLNMPLDVKLRIMKDAITS